VARRLGSLLVALAVLAPVGSASAQTLGLGRRLGRPLSEAPPTDEPAAAPDEGEDEERPWVGPQIQLAYTYWKLADAHGGGDTHSASLEVFLQWPISELRTGVLGELGGRDYSLAGDDLVVRGALELGFQLTELLDPLVPHLSLVVSFGGVVGERFETTVSHAFGGAGVELGAALRMVRNLHLAASLAYHRLEMDGAAFDVFMLRLGLGL
jgi:hypothetical protein